MVNWMAKRINIRPTTSVYATYKNIRYDPWTAIAEFVDNSTQSYYDNTEKLNSTKYWNGLAVDIEYKRDKVSGDHLIIKDNAYGMDFRDFQRAIMLDSPPRKKSRSEFGMGLKTAACWFGKCWSVESVALGSGVKYKTTVDVEALSKYKKMAKCASVYLAINHHLVMWMHKAKAKALMLKLVKRSVKIY